MFHDEPKTYWWVIFGVICAMAASAIVWPVKVHPPIANPRSRSLSNLKQLGYAMTFYAADWDDFLPPKSRWENSVSSYMKNPNVFQIHTWKKEALHRSALNESIGNIKLSQIESPEITVEIFESASLSKNQSGGSALAAYDPKDYKTLLLFADNHVKAFDYAVVGNFRWEPRLANPKSKISKSSTLKQLGK